MKKLIAGMIIGSALTATTSVFADSIKEYILTKVEYPIVVKGKEYTNTDLPVLNYQGNTYVPLKAVGDVLGSKVDWNAQLKRVEIGELVNNSTGISGTIGQQPSNISTPQPTDNNSSDKIEVLKDYIPNTGSPAIKYQNIIYLPIRAGAEKYNLNVSWDEKTRTVMFEKTTIQAKVEVALSANADGFIIDGSSYIKESILKDASTAVQNYQANTKLDYLLLNKSYTSSDNGMTVTVTAINVTDKGGYYEYSIAYDQQNNTEDKPIDEGTFKIFYKNGDSEPQYGFFNKLMPGEKVTRTYVFKGTKSQIAYCMEYGTSNFSSKGPSEGTLKWKVELNQ